MNILIIGGGGREHALGWKIAQSPKCEKLWFSPGNGGTSKVGENVALNLAQHQDVVDFCSKENIGLVVIGPDDFLAAGLADSLQAGGIKAFGASKSASKLEWSKEYAKEFMIAHNIPTATYKAFDKYEGAVEYVKSQTFPVVIKADGLALGKGVVIAQNFEEAETALNAFMRESVHGDAGKRIVIEEYLEGHEFSIHAFCDGENIAMFPSSEDHKRIFDNDMGPNTGGMGTIAPLPWVTPEMMKEIEDKIVRPLILNMQNQGTPFVGLLYPGIMWTKSGPKVIEINARFGDPEAQSYMRLLETDLVDICLACCDGSLNEVKIEWKNAYASCIVLASVGYPGTYPKGLEITGLEDSGQVVIFHAGTKKDGERAVTSGGRVLGVTATADTLQNALDKAYESVGKISFEGKQFRQDIGHKSLKRIS